MVTASSSGWWKLHVSFSLRNSSRTPCTKLLPSPSVSKNANFASMEGKTMEPYRKPRFHVSIGRLLQTKEPQTYPKCEFSFNPAETSIQPAGDNVRDEGVIVYPYRRELDCVEKQVSRTRCCHQFELTKTNLGDYVHHLELPIRFAKECGLKFQACVLLLGPCGLRRIVKLKFSSTVHTTIRVQFQHRRLERFRA